MQNHGVPHPAPTEMPMTRTPSDLLFGCTASGATHRYHDTPDIATKVKMVKDAGVFDYIDRCPPDEEFRDLLVASGRYDLPVLSGGWFYTLGRDEGLFERNVLSHHASHDDSSLGHISCEHIVFPDYGGGHKYSTFDTNVACAHWLRNAWAQALHHARTASLRPAAPPSPV